MTKQRWRKVYTCDEHGAELDKDGRCVTLQDGIPGWHKPDVLDIRERSVRVKRG